MQKFAAVLVCVLILVPGAACADGFGTALNIMFINRSPDALSASRGNTWVADPEGSSNNPACIAAGEPFKAAGSTNYSATFFAKGPTLHTYEASFYATMPFGGVTQLTLSNSQSGFAATRMDGDSVRLDHQPYFDIAYGRQVGENVLRNGDKFFVGVGGGMNCFKMGFASQGHTNFISRSRGFSLYGGALYQPTENLNFGASYSWSRDFCEDRDIESGTSARYTSDIHQARVGASWNVLPNVGTTVAIDVQYLNLGHVNRIQPFVGVQQQIIKDRLYIHVGSANLKGFTLGPGLYFKNGGVNVAYSYNTNPELNPYFGQSHTIMATAFIKW